MGVRSLIAATVVVSGVAAGTIAGIAIADHVAAKATRPAKAPAKSATKSAKSATNTAKTASTTAAKAPTKAKTAVVKTAAAKASKPVATKHGDMAVAASAPKAAATPRMLAAPTPNRAAPTVFLERGGRVVEHDGEQVEMPAFGGGDRVWSSIVSCTQQHFAPFQINITDREPSGDHITVVVGGLASQLGLDDRSTNGVGPYMPGRIQRNATVYVFSQVSGERDANNLCAVAAHEIGHALGLDHSNKCGDVMSYYGDRCGKRQFLDADAACGEFETRSCGTGEDSQNSYRMLASVLGLRAGKPEPQPEPEPQVQPRQQPQPSVGNDPWGNDDNVDDRNTDDSNTNDDNTTDDDATDDTADADDGQQYWRGRDGKLYTVQYVRDRRGRTWAVLRPVR